MATVSIGRAGAVNAGVLAAQILGVSDPAIARRLETYKKSLEDQVERAAAGLTSGARDQASVPSSVSSKAF